MGPSEIYRCTSIGSTPFTVHGKDFVRMCIGEYVDKDGLHHPIDLKIEVLGVNWVPWCPMNVLAIPSLVEHNAHQFTGLWGNELYMPTLQTKHWAHIIISPKT